MQKNLLIKIVFFLFFVIPANSEIIKGTAVVVDGDTLKIDNKKIVLTNADNKEKKIFLIRFKVLKITNIKFSRRLINEFLMPFQIIIYSIITLV